MRDFLEETLNALRDMKLNSASRLLTKAWLFANSVKYSEEKIAKYRKDLKGNVDRLLENPEALGLNKRG
jgi:hypothetical protein